ncbi:MAG: DUF3090 family protein [Chloroflexota bacterium]|nr:DUF3090 family protein [Chloroflexota bacterium]
MVDFGSVSSIEAEAVGVPGQRTFRLRLRSGERTASLWLEKEQLQALALALMRLLVRLGRTEEFPSQPEAGPPPAEAGSGQAPSAGSGQAPSAEAALSALPPFPEQPSLDIKVGRLGLGYDQARENVVLFAYDIEEEGEEAEAALACRASLQQCHDLIAMIEAVVAAGRPLCRLCLCPIDPEGHVCARSNGHRPKRDLEMLR